MTNPIQQNESVQDPIDSRETRAMKKRVLLVGGGAVGTIAALNLEASGLAEVTAVLRGNYAVVQKFGFNIRSCDHVVSEIPDVLQNNEVVRFDYLILALKNFPDIPPSLTTYIAPAVTPGHTSIILLQNGINIEKPFHAAFPSNPILSGVIHTGVLESSPGHVDHTLHEILTVGEFHNSLINRDIETMAAMEFVRIYGSTGRAECKYSNNVTEDRWRKLFFNATFNPVSAITGLDMGRLCLGDRFVETLVRPAMEELRAAGLKAGCKFPERIIEDTINYVPPEKYLAPSMLTDVRKGRFIEFENLVGEPLREGKSLGVPMPTMEVLYNLCRAIQWRTKEANGMVTLPPKQVQENTIPL